MTHKRRPRGTGRHPAITVRLPWEIVGQLENLAAATNRNRSEVARQGHRAWSAAVPAFVGRRPREDRRARAMSTSQLGGMCWGDKVAGDDAKGSVQIEPTRSVNMTVE
jgi:predicted transcriptional regulator